MIVFRSCGLRFCLDLRAAQLRNGEPGQENEVPLSRKPWDVLCYLVGRRGDAVNREELLKEVWESGGTTVGSNSLDKAVSDIRKAIGDKHPHQVIKTVRGRGYRFTAPVEGDVTPGFPALQPTSHNPNATKPRVFEAQLPRIDLTLFGREKYLYDLDTAWSSRKTFLIQLVAAGGTGKTALVNYWFRRHIGETDIFAWSFYSQGTNKSQTSSELFFNALTEWLEITVSKGHSVYAKVNAVAEHLRNERVLLILDGLEPLQDRNGRLSDERLRMLLYHLETENAGMIVCTSRYGLEIKQARPRTFSIDLDNLNREDGARYLEFLKVYGDPDELCEASEEYGNNALALTLLGTYLEAFYRGDVSCRVELRKLLINDDDKGSHARRVMVAYHKTFCHKPEEQILLALSYFDHATDLDLLRLLLPIDKEKYRIALHYLRTVRLILPSGPNNEIDCHPLIREYFAEVERASAPRNRYTRRHRLLYDHYRHQQETNPETLDAMMPLFSAIFHGCQAKLQWHCLRIYRSQLLRQSGLELSGHAPDGAYLTRYLGAFGTDVAVLANFFETLWSKPIASFSEREKMFVTARAASSLRALGRLRDALPLMRKAAAAAAKLKDWENAAVEYGNLSQLLLTLGDIRHAIATAELSVSFANASGVPGEMVARRTKLAEAVFQSGDRDRARRLFEEAERMQAEHDPTRPILYAVSGFRYCDFLLSEGHTDDVIDRASRAHSIDALDNRRLNIGLDHLSLGRANPAGSATARLHLDLAVEILRNSYVFMLLPALLARATSRDLKEVLQIASRSQMKLFLVDYHLVSARKSVVAGDLPIVSDHVKSAERLINETGYHRRDSDLASLRAILIDRCPR